MSVRETEPTSRVAPNWGHRPERIFPRWQDFELVGLTAQNSTGAPPKAAENERSPMQKDKSARYVKETDYLSPEQRADAVAEILVTIAGRTLGRNDDRIQ